MDWQCEWGQYLPQIISKHKQGDDLPAFVERMPVLPDSLHWVRDAFSTLAASRNIGMAAGPIPLSEIEAYVRLFGLVDDDLERFVHLIYAMDGAWLKWANKKKG